MSFVFQSSKIKNIDKIEERINNLFFENAGLVEQDATYLSNARHISLIEKAVESLQAVNEGLELGMPVDLLQVDLTRTWEILGEITGDAAPDELITQLFSQFCLGNKKSMIVHSVMDFIVFISNLVLRHLLQLP